MFKPLQNNRAPVNIHNWHTHEAFREFLEFHFSIQQCSLESRTAINTLLPACVTAGRLSGAITNIILREAMEAWNRPEGYHKFTFTKERWRYMGEIVEAREFNSIPTGMVIYYGTLRRAVAPGSICAKPERELLPAAKKI